jgi:hypothetical protein
MWDPKTGSVHETLDVIWLRQMYYKPDPDHIPINIAPTNNAPIPPAKAEEGEENADPIVEVEEGQEDEPAESRQPNLKVTFWLRHTNPATIL